MQTTKGKMEKGERSTIERVSSLPNGSSYARRATMTTMTTLGWDSMGLLITLIPTALVLGTLVGSAEKDNGTKTGGYY
jgi:hypothetical protein